jgi:ABC-type sugar transport system ATPase subunit
MIELRGIDKGFQGVVALDDVSLRVERGECHALMGENGAGKSTLGRVLAGIHRPDSGEIVIDGRSVRFRSPADALAAGVAMVHQELAFCPDLSVAENLCLGRWPTRARLLVDRGGMARHAEQVLSRIGVTLDVRAPMRALSTAQEQLVQIAAAVDSGASMLIFDEPTSSLSETEAGRLFELVESLKQRGVTMLYVSHRIPEVFRLADRISVLRDGRHVATRPAGEVTPDELVRLMIGRELDEFFAGPPRTPPGEIVLEVEQLASPGRFEPLSFRLQAGEIVGLAGLVGSGRSEVARALFGLDRRARGRISVLGRPLRPGSPRRAIAAGMALVPEDRKRQGLVLGLSARANWSLPVLERLRRGRLIDGAAESRQAAEAFERVDLRAASIEAPVAELSGGNQQKVVLARWLGTGARVLIVDEPTRGVDVGAKASIHALLADRAHTGAGILLISSEMPELMALSSRMLVMREGRLVGELSRHELTRADAQAEVLRLMAGVGV